MGSVIYYCFAWLCFDARLVDRWSINQRYLTNQVGWLRPIRLLADSYNFFCWNSLYVNLPVHLLVVRSVRRGLVALPVERALHSDTSNAFRTIIGFDSSGAFTFYHPDREHVFTTILHHVLARGYKRVRPITGTMSVCKNTFLIFYLPSAKKCKWPCHQVVWCVCARGERNPAGNASEI